MLFKKIIYIMFGSFLCSQFVLAQSSKAKNDNLISKSDLMAKANTKSSKKKTSTKSNEIPLLKDTNNPIIKDSTSESKSNSGESDTDEKSTNSGAVSANVKEVTKSHRQWVLSVASWRENSILTKDDRKIKINTLNVSGRIDRLIYFSDNRLYFNFGLIAGQSENMNAESDFTYFQRQVMLSGLEFQLGAPLFRRGGAEFAISAGGLARVINHALPGSDYKFSTATRFVPLVAFDFTWQIFQRFFFHQSIGTTGVIGDTFWSAGFGLDI